MNKVLLISVIIIGIVFTLIVVISFFIQQPTPLPLVQQQPTITPYTPPKTYIPDNEKDQPPIPQDSKEYKEAAAIVAQQEKQILQDDSYIIEFRDSLPYTGTFITINYDIKTNKYNVFTNKQTQQQANEELQIVFEKYKVNKKYITVEIIYQ